MYESGSIFVDVRFDENGPLVTPFDRFEAEVSFLGKNFKDVFRGISDIQTLDSFSEISINSAVGIVNFIYIQRLMGI